MPSLRDTLQQIDILRQQIESKGKLPDDVLRKVEYKFRLECNYHSNRIEGGTLTKLETRSVMTGNITVDGKPLKDIREMEGHDAVMLQILHIGRGEMRPSPTRIREMHRTVIVEEDPAKQQVGEWKKEDNHIINYRLERFDFTPHAEVPDKIQDLLNWLNAGLDKIKSGKKDAPDPLLLAFEFHLRYLTIHPFLDGNGRTARLLTNLVLVSCGYPPFWVSEGGEKEVYNRYLADVQAYGGDPELLYNFMAGLVLRSLHLVKDAIAGKDIEGDDDWFKKLQLLKSSLSDDQVKLSRTPETVQAVFEQSIWPCLVQVMDKLSAFDELFLERELRFGEEESNPPKINVPADIVRAMAQRTFPPRTVKFVYRLNGFKKAIKAPFSISCNLLWRLEEYDYAFFLSGYNDDAQFYHYYHQYYALDEIAEIVKQCGRVMWEQMDEELGNVKI